MKKQSSWQIVLSLLFITPLFTQHVSASELSDISNHWAKPAVEWAVKSEVVNGYQDGTFQPNKSVTEAEFLAMLIRFFPNSKAQLTDLQAQVPAPPHWADNYYAVAKLYNIPVNGASKVDKRNQPVSRGQVAQMIAGAFGLNYDVDGAIAYLYDMGLSKGKGDKPTIVGFDAKAALTRAEAVQFLKTIADKVADLSMRQRAQTQQTNPNVSKYKGGTTQPKPPVQQPQTGFRVPTIEEIKMVFDIQGYEVSDDGNTANGFIVYKNNSHVLSVVVQGSLTQFSANMKSLHKNPELPMLVQQVVALYGLPSETVAYDINKGKDNALTKKYGNYTVKISTQGLVTSLIIRK